MLSKRRIQEIEHEVSLSERMFRAIGPDTGDEVVVMLANLHSELALVAVPELLAEIKRLRGSAKAETSVPAKWDRTVGYA